MLKERLQVMVSSDQRQRLEEEARRRAVSVAAIVREAIDRQVGVPSRDERLLALEGIRRLQGRYLAPHELEAIVDEERADNAG
jgi:ribosome maturation protein Sdo1